MARLDTTRSFATTHGAGATHKYEQDGKRFDNQGRQLADHPIVISSNAADVPDTVDLNPPGPYDYMKMPQLRAVAAKRGQKFKVGTSAVKAREILREMDAAE